MPPSTSPVSPTPPPQPLRMQVLTAVPHFPGTLVGRRRKAALPRAAPASASGQPSSFSFPSPPPPPSPPTATVSPSPPPSSPPPPPARAISSSSSAAAANSRPNAPCRSPPPWFPTSASPG